MVTSSVILTKLLYVECG